MESNFSFIKDIFPKTYKHLAEAEKNVRINQAIDVRLALEALITERLEQAGQEDLFKKYGAKVGKPLKKQTLQEHIALCQNRNHLSEFGWNKDFPVLPPPGRIEYYTLMNGKNAPRDEYDFLRMYGNAKSHDSNGRNDFLRIDYTTSVRALKKLHRILGEICRRDFPTAMHPRKFKENLMPIQGAEYLYFIDEAGVPADAPMSKCQMECRAHFSQSEGATGIEYAIIRQYNKRDAERMFLLRNKAAMKKAEDPMGGLPYCVRSPEVLSSIDNEHSPFYIVAYHFQEKPQSLSDALLEKLDMKTRVSVCADIARGMADIHQRNIYQRILTYGNVYICDYSDKGIGIHPHLVKFDFAKLEHNQGSDAVGTVLPWAIEARNKIEDERLRKYINEKDWQDERWEKADIYALGVLFCDILSGRINKNHDAMETAMGEVFDSQQLSENFAGFLEQMLDDIAGNRPAAAEVQRVMEAEMRKWN